MTDTINVMPRLVRGIHAEKETTEEMDGPDDPPIKSGEGHDG